jgi:hypothetical protein
LKVIIKGKVQMFRRLVQWLKSFFQRLFGRQQNPSPARGGVQAEPAPPLSDTDLEFLFTELLTGVHQARGQAWAQKWLHNIEHRISTDRWVEWLQRFGEKVLASRTPNNELAARLVQLGELDIGPIGDFAYSLGMQVLTRNQGEPVWEYDGPDATNNEIPDELISSNFGEDPPDGDFQTVTQDELLTMLQQDENLRRQVAEQLAIDTDDPQLIIQTLISQSQPD